MRWSWPVESLLVKVHEAGKLDEPDDLPSRLLEVSTRIVAWYAFADGS